MRQRPWWFLFWLIRYFLKMGNTLGQKVPVGFYVDIVNDHKVSRMQLKGSFMMNLVLLWTMRQGMNSSVLIGFYIKLRPIGSGESMNWIICYFSSEMSMYNRTQRKLQIRCM